MRSHQRTTLPRLFALALLAAAPVFATQVPSPRVSQAYVTHDQDIANPERGFHEQARAYIPEQTASTPYTRLSQNSNLTQFGSLGTRKITVVHRLISLKNYRDADLPAAFLQNIRNDLDDARSLNIKLYLRFAYTFDGGAYTDPSIERMEGHIAQLGALLSEQNNSDVVTHLDAGMLGPWGEWGTSAGLRSRIVHKWLDVLPADRSIALRTPEYKRALFGQSALGSGFDGTDAARVGHHNDCYLASLTDQGTYSSSFNLRDAQKNYLRDENRFVPMSGETCAYFQPGGECGAGEDCSNRSGCATALAESARLRWSLLNTRWFDGLVLPTTGQWHQPPNACYAEMKRRLGYRFELVSSELPVSASAGACNWNASVVVRNRGFAAPFGPRGLKLVLEPVAGGAATLVDLLQPNSPIYDPRRWLPDAGDITLSLGSQLPAGLAPGNYRLHLFLPDGRSGLQNNPAYSIQTANTGLWNATRGWNSLNHTVSVSACSSYTVGGTVSGVGTGAALTLRNTVSGENLPHTGSGGFTFTTPQANGASYNVIVQTPPAGQTCTVSNGSGVIAGANVNTIAVSCAASNYSVGGSISGLASAPVTLRNTVTGEDLQRSSNGPFTFTTSQAAGASYNVIVGNQPSGLTCSVSQGSGVISGHVSTVAVLCSSGSSATQTSILSAAPQNVTLGQPVSVAFSVSSAAGTPGGTVTVSDSLSSCSASVASGSCTLRFYRGGTRSLQASYGGGGGFLPSSSASSSYTVARYARGASASAAPETTGVGAPVRLRVQFEDMPVPVPGDPPYPEAGGSVSFASVQGPACTATLPGSECNASFPQVSAPDMTVEGVYSGDSNYLPTTTSPARVTILASRATDCISTSSVCYGHNGLSFSGLTLSYPGNPVFSLFSPTPAGPGQLQLSQQGSWSSNSPLGLTGVHSENAAGGCIWTLDGTASNVSLLAGPGAPSLPRQLCAFAHGDQFFPLRTMSLGSDRILRIGGFHDPEMACQSSSRSPAPLIDLDIYPDRYVPGSLREEYREDFRVLRFLPDCLFADGFQ